jgi:hypothetical protein
MNLEYKNKVDIVRGYYCEVEDMIVLAKGLGELEREVTYYHEREHQKCFRNKCKCWNRKSDYLCEYHAMRGECRSVLQRGSKRLAIAYLLAIQESLARYKQGETRWLGHKLAAVRVMKSKDFAAVERLAKS